MKKLVFLFFLVFFGCQKNNTSAKEDNHSSDESISKKSRIQFASSDGPFGKFDPPIQLKSFLATSPVDKFPKGDDWNNNVYLRGISDELGINIKWEWSASGPDFTTKLNTSIASGDLSDLILLSSSLYYELARKGALLDLTQAYQRFASPKIRKMIEEPYDGFFFNNVLKVDGKIYGLAPGEIYVNSVFQLGVLRKDWLDKLGLEMPKTADDLYEILDAFANKDPDGNGRKDTLGIGVAGNLVSGISSASGIFGIYNSHPFDWVKDGDKIVYGSFTNGTKKALEKLAELYSKGIIDPDYFSKNAWDDAVVVKGNPGVLTGVSWLAEHLSINKSQYPDANWQFFEIPDENGNPIKSFLGMGNGPYMVSQKSFKHPDAIVKIANFVSQKYENDSKYSGFKEDGAFVDYMAIADSIVSTVDPFKEVNIAKASWKAFESGDKSKLSGLGLGKFNQAKRYVDKKQANDYGEYMYLKPDDGSMALTFKIYNEKRYLKPPYYGSKTRLQSKYMPGIISKTEEVFVNIITGKISSEEGIANLKKYWDANGGPKIDQEMAKWQKEHKAL